MSNEGIEKLEHISGIEETAGTQETATQRGTGNKEKFDSLMEGGPQNGGVALAEERAKAMPTPMETARDLSKGGFAEMVNYDKLAAQANEASKKIEEIKKVLSSPDAKIKHTSHQLLENKLSHIHDSLRIALSRTGIEVPSAEATEVSAASGKGKRVNPIERFIGFLTDGQNQLENLSGEIKTMGNTKQLSPLDVLAVQVKVNQITQELELFTNVLNKGLESVKTLMNVQV